MTITQVIGRGPIRPAAEAPGPLGLLLSTRAPWSRLDAKAIYWRASGRNRKESNSAPGKRRGSGRGVYRDEGIEILSHGYRYHLDWRRAILRSPRT